ncbi:MAG: sulfotransferase family 2 domain-containing protein [Flavobacteriales bacterium]|nr:sulfotransferase family 2 domain-containing protein [Flavobacteriales bacterium]
MFITDRFVLLNFPKTGSTFARNVLAELHRPSALRAGLIKLGLAKPLYQDLILPRYVVDPSVPVRTTQHLVYAQIAEEHRHKLLLTVVRDPFNRLISAFEYRDWVRFPMAPIDELRNSWPTFPELTFQEFLEMNYKLGPKQLIGDLPMHVDVGPLTLQFIRFYARDPRNYLLDLRPGWDLLTGRIGTSLHPVPPYGAAER